MSSETLPNTDRTPEEWEEIFWKKEYFPFHSVNAHRMLTKHYDSVFTPNSSVRVFVPLCGKSVDMKWLADKGHEVVGLEFSEIAIASFFEEQGLEFEKVNDENCKEHTIFKAKDTNITIHQGDFYALAMPEKLGKFDMIWDKGSFSTCGSQNRIKYVKLMKDLAKHGSQYLLITFCYEGNYNGAPYSINKSTMDESFGQHFTYQNLDSNPISHPYLLSKGAKDIMENVHKLSPK